MTVGELIVKLSAEDPNMEVIIHRNSDYAPVRSLEQIKVESHGGDWYEEGVEFRLDTTPKERVKTCLHLSYW